MPYPRLTKCMPDETRHNPFHLLHKVLRLAHCRMIAELGTQDFADGDAPARLMLRLVQKLELNRTAAEARHQALLPLLGAQCLEAAAGACRDLSCHLAAIAELHSLIRAFNVATPPRRVAAGRTLYRCYALFGAADMGRMDREETALLANLHHQLSEAELRALEDRMLALLPPDQLHGLLQLAVLALTAAERQQLLAQLQRSVDARLFAALSAGAGAFPRAESIAGF